MSLLSTPRVKAVVQSEAPGTLSREVVTVTQSGSAIQSGTVLGKITASGKYIPYLDSASDGSQAGAAVLLQTLPAKTGDTKATVIMRLAELHRADLVGLDANGEADLKALNVIVRDRIDLPTVATPTLS